MSLTNRLALAFLVLVPVARAEDPASPAATQPARVKAAEPQVYDEKADARAEITAALARAKKENRRVLVQWGANWCGWCKWLHGTLTKDAALAKELLYEYDVVRVDVGQFDKNIELAKSFGAEFKSIPWLTVLDADGKPLAQDDTTAFEIEADGKQGHDPKKLLAFFTTNQTKPLAADAVRDAAFARAKAEGKRVFLHFGAPWCGWCHKLEDWMAQPAVAALLAKDFVDLKIDTDRMTGGAELLAAARKTAGIDNAGGIPWFVLLDAGGMQLATSEGPKGNVGFPYQDDEIAHFVSMLEKARLKLTADDVATLRASLVAVRTADEEKKKARAASSSDAKMRELEPAH